MNRLNIERAITEAESSLHPCEHTFYEGVCTKCFCPETQKYVDKAWQEMRQHEERELGLS